MEDHAEILHEQRMDSEFCGDCGTRHNPRYDCQETDGDCKSCNGRGYIGLADCQTCDGQGSVPKPCACCEAPIEDRGIHDPWKGRMDAFCYDCALTRCDAYPKACCGGIKADWEMWAEEAEKRNGEME